MATLTEIRQCTFEIKNVTQYMTPEKMAEGSADYRFLAEHPQRRLWQQQVKSWGGFSSKDYGALYLDVKWPSLMLAQHYYRHGMFEDRRPSALTLLDEYKRSRLAKPDQPLPTIIRMLRENAPELRGKLAFVDPKAKPVKDIINEWGGFDPHWYLTMNPDVAAAGKDPLTHFCESGLYECRDPNRQMNVRKYCLENENKNFAVAPAIFWMMREQHEQATQNSA